MQVYVGIDWSQKKHDVVFMNPAGASIAEFTIPHSPDGFFKLDATRAQLGLAPTDCLVGLETAHNLLIDFLWERDYHWVYVVPPNVTKSSRGRYRQSGAYSDASDAFVVADLLRTDRGRLQPWFPDSLLTQQLRAKVSLLSHLTQSIVRLTNRLRAVLLRYYPAAVEVFSDLTTLIALEFVQAYPTPQAAAGLTWEQFQAFAKQHRYSQPKKLPGCFARLQASQPEANCQTVLVFQEEAPLLANLLLSLVRAKNATLRELQLLFNDHPDYSIFSSLPGTGDFLAPALLAKFGDDRHRFPSAASLQALAGTCPVTKTSGQRKLVVFRYACDREFRHIAQQWALSSLKESAWANAYWRRVRPHCRSDSQAYRCLANRWLAVAWKLWQTSQPYDEAYHLRQRALRSKPRS